jgi:ribosomal protein S18 acetylase RimI-like enzyme
VDPLDNVFWHALNGSQRQFSLGDERARRFREDIGPFGALPDGATAENYAALAELVGSGNSVVLFRDDPAPDAWEVIGTINAVQMIGPMAPLTHVVDPRVSTLGVDDVDDMMSLTSQTKPGPFLKETWQLGTYLGIRVDGRLVAMAGQRARTPDYVEISAVCTDTEFTGRGLARALVLAQVEIIISAGQVPMLHAAATNTRAISLYEAWGFQHRRTISGAILRTPL